MNKTIIKLGLLLALSLPAGAMEEPKAPEAPAISARLSDARQQEIMDILSSLQKLVKSNSNTNFYNEKLPEIWDKEKGVLECEKISQYVNKTLNALVNYIISGDVLSALSVNWFAIAPEDIPIFQNQLDEIIPKIKSLQKCQKELVNSDTFNDHIKNIYRILSEFDTDESLESPSKVENSKQMNQVTFKLINDIKAHFNEIKRINKLAHNCRYELSKKVNKKMATKSKEVLSELNRLAQERGMVQNIPDAPNKWGDEKGASQYDEKAALWIRTVLYKIAQYDCQENKQDLIRLFTGDQECLGKYEKYLRKLPKIQDYIKMRKEKISNFEKYIEKFNREIKNKILTFEGNVAAIYDLLNEFYKVNDLWPEGKAFNPKTPVDAGAKLLILIAELKKCMPSIEKGAFFIDVPDAGKIKAGFAEEAKNVLADFGKLVQTAGFSAEPPAVCDETYKLMNGPIAKYVRDALESILQNDMSSAENDYQVYNKYSGNLNDVKGANNAVKELGGKIKKMKTYFESTKSDHNFQADIRNANYLLDQFFDGISFEKEMSPNGEVVSTSQDTIVEYLEVIRLIDKIKSCLPTMEIMLDPNLGERDYSYELAQIKDITDFFKKHSNISIDSKGGKFTAILNNAPRIFKAGNPDELFKQRWFGLVKSFKICNCNLKDNGLFTDFEKYLENSPELEKIEFVNCDFDSRIRGVLQHLQSVCSIKIGYPTGIDQSSIVGTLDALSNLPGFEIVELSGLEALNEDSMLHLLKLINCKNIKTLILKK